MSLHLDAPPGSIAPSVLLPGDPLRAQRIAEGLLADPVRVNQRRAAYGFTGRFQDRKVSVQATGMGMPSMAIYSHELISEYGARTLVRIGTCGALQPGLQLGDLVLVLAAGTDSAMNRLVFGGSDFAPAADFTLLQRAHAAARARGLTSHVGTVVTSDAFYSEPGWEKPWRDHGVLAAEMETSALYTVAARHRVAALAILTVSDIIGGSDVMPPEDRERSLLPMAQVALEAVSQ